jgi:hypothetical protein
MDHLLSQAQAILSTTPSRWPTLTSVIPEELLTLAPESGEWSAIQCLQHLLDTDQKVFPIRLRAFLAGQNFPGFNPDTDGQKPGSRIEPSALSASFTSVRNTNLKLLAGIKPSDLMRTALHAELGKVTLAEMLNEWIGHDLMHTVQAERAMMQPFVVGSGPWRLYFKDHDVAAHPAAKQE